MTLGGPTQIFGLNFSKLRPRGWIFHLHGVFLAPGPDGIEALEGLAVWVDTAAVRSKGFVLDVSGEDFLDRLGQANVRLLDRDVGWRRIQVNA